MIIREKELVSCLPQIWSTVYLLQSQSSGRFAEWITGRMGGHLSLLSSSILQQPLWHGEEGRKEIEIADHDLIAFPNLGITQMYNIIEHVAIVVLQITLFSNHIISMIIGERTCVLSPPDMFYTIFIAESELRKICWMNNREDGRSFITPVLQYPPAVSVTRRGGQKRNRN